MAMLFFIYGFYFISAQVKGISEIKANNKEINVDVQTIIEFDEKSKSSDSMPNERNLVGRLRLAIDKDRTDKEVFKSRSHDNTREIFTEFLINIIDIVNRFNDEDLVLFVKTLNNELKRYDYKGCKFNKLTKNSDLETAFSTLFDALNNLPPKTIRRKANTIKNKLKYNKFDQQERKVFNSLYTPKDTDAFKAFLNDTTAFKSKIDHRNIVKIVKEGVRRFIFNHYSKLNVRIRKSLIDTLKILWNHLTVQPIKKIYTKTTKNYDKFVKIHTTKELRTYKQMYVEKNLDLKYNPYVFDHVTANTNKKLLRHEKAKQLERNNVKYKNINNEHFENKKEKIKRKDYHKKSLYLFDFKAQTGNLPSKEEIIDSKHKPMARTKFERKLEEKLPIIQVNEFSARLEGLIHPNRHTRRPQKIMKKKQTITNTRRFITNISKEKRTIKQAKFKPIDFRRNYSNITDIYNNKTKIEQLENELTEMKNQMAKANNIINNLKLKASENQKLLLELKYIQTNAKNYSQADVNKPIFNNKDDKSIILIKNSSISSKEFRSDLKKDLNTNNNEYFDNINTIQSNFTVQYTTILINENKNGEIRDLDKNNYEDDVNYNMETTIDPKIMAGQLFTPIENGEKLEGSLSSGDDTDKDKETPTTAKYASSEEYKDIIDGVNQKSTLTPTVRYQFTTPRPYTQRSNLIENNDVIEMNSNENFNKGVKERLQKQTDEKFVNLTVNSRGGNFDMTTISEAMGAANSLLFMGSNSLKGGNLPTTPISGRKGAQESGNINLATGNMVNVREYSPKTLKEIKKPIYNLTADLHYEFPEFADILGKLVTNKLTLDLD